MPREVFPKFLMTGKMEMISSNRSIGILDYGIGNLKSIGNAIERLGYNYYIISSR